MLLNSHFCEMFAVITEIYQDDQMQVFCEDNNYRKGMAFHFENVLFSNGGDLVVGQPWSTDKCEVKWKYTLLELTYLKRTGNLPEFYELGNTCIKKLLLFPTSLMMYVHQTNQDAGYVIKILNFNLLFLMEKNYR